MTQFSALQSDVIFNYIHCARNSETDDKGLRKDEAEEKLAIELLAQLFGCTEAEIVAEFERRV